MLIKGPWKIKSSEEKYKNPWIRVREDRVIRPDGKDGIFGVVEMIPGVSIIPIDEDGFAYLTEEYHYAIEKNSIEAISGGIDKKESPLEAAKRELQEEAGIIAEDWIDLGEVNPFTTVIFSPQKVYLARKLKFTQSDPEGTEVIKILRVKFAEVLKMAMDSKITHGPTLCLIFKINQYLNINI